MMSLAFSTICGSAPRLQRVSRVAFDNFRQGGLEWLALSSERDKTGKQDPGFDLLRGKA
jgi:hypothetical protein